MTKRTPRIFIHWCAMTSEWCAYGSVAKKYLGLNLGRIHAEVAWNR